MFAGVFLIVLILIFSVLGAVALFAAKTKKQWRIVRRLDGRYEIQKRGSFAEWNTVTGLGSFDTRPEAEDILFTQTSSNSVVGTYDEKGKIIK